MPTSSAPIASFGAHEPLVVSRRGHTPENVHYGSIAVVDAQGTLLHSAGDPTFVTFTRSALKAFQALPFLLDDGPRHFGLTTQETALLTASHSGEAAHVEAVDGLLSKAGQTMARLRCGCHVPYVYEATGRAVPAEARFDARHHNCSGKHAGFLAYCALHGLPTESYLDPQHPLQQRIRHEVARLLGAQPDTLATGTDGCSAPNLALPLAQLARLWAMVASGSGHAHTDACFEQIFSVMTRHPDMVSGTDRPDLHFSQAGRGDWVAKAGADGVQTFAIRSRGLGIAIKIADGHAQARYVAAVEVLRTLGLADPGDSHLSRYARMPLHNIAGLRVGELHPVFTLRSCAP
jgi:L-asparaginase II